MRKKLSLLFLSICIVFQLTAQQTLTLQPGPEAGKDAILISNQASTNFGSSESAHIQAWTMSGNEVYTRSIMQFDLSSIPAGAIITEARLSLYYNPTTPYAATTSLDPFIIKRIDTDWNEITVSWNNQPTCNGSNMVTVPAGSSTTQDFADINVTALVQDMIDNPSAGYGFMIMLQNETPYRGIIFASSDNPDSTVRPKLVITYTQTTGNTLVLQPGDNDGKDAILISNQATTNFGTSESAHIQAWTMSGNEVFTRSIMQFDLSSIPSNAIITNARLSLYYNPTTPYAAATSLDPFYIRRIVTDWNELTVTWDNQPTSTNMNVVTVPAGSSVTQDYPDINVTTLVQDMVSDPSISFGFMLMFVTETPYKGVIFASSDNPDTTVHPKLVVNYTIPNGVSDIAPSMNMNIWPNPSSSGFNVSFANNNSEKYLVQIHSITGALVFSSETNSDNLFVETDSFINGLYFVQIVKDNQVIAVSKFLKTE